MVEENIFICTQAQGLLLAWYVCQDLGIISKDYPKQLNVKKTTQAPVAEDQQGWVHLGEIPENPTPSR